MEIKQEDNGEKGKFYVEIDGKQEAEMIYSYAGQGKIIIEHTEVSEKLKGQGIGYKLQDKLRRNKAQYDHERLREWKERKRMRTEDEALKEMFL
jgi:predicted GNAT family acetyltransferase